MRLLIVKGSGLGERNRYIRHMRKPLLAKSYSLKKCSAEPPQYALLTKHSRDVAEACGTLADIVGKIGLEVLGLKRKIPLNQLKIELKASGWLQDLGKVSSHFQEMVSGESNMSQLLRHETVSGLLALNEDLPFREWLSSKFCEKSLLTITWAAMGHHRKLCKGTKPKEALPLTADISHPDFISIIQEMGQDLGLDSSTVLKTVNEKKKITITKNHRDKGDINAQRELRDLQDLFCEKVDLFSDGLDKRYLALIKALGIASDVVASAVAKKEVSNYSLSDFIKENFKYGLKASDFLPIIGDKKPYEFQNKVAEAEGYLTFAKAGCGSGKSLAAYLWARKWCERYFKKGRANFRLFFCLPTTGTTTEHFKDYALESGIPSEMLNLTHSRSKVDLTTIAKTDSRKEAGRNSKELLLAERNKIESLALWSAPLVVSTTDTILGLVSNSRKPIYSLPSILCGAVVFDEIHAFDDQMFGHLLVFLKNFPKLPVLLMTASLSEKRLEAIKKVRHDFTDKDCINGDRSFAELERYRVKEVIDKNEIWNEIKRCVRCNGKVLWVQNQVNWANQTYLNCKESFPNVDVNVYHSRLKYKHRSKRHRHVIDKFKESRSPTILVATQVAEISLDLSADLLITDIAPIPSLIQRMGRLNRKLHEKPENKREIKSALVHLLPKNGFDPKPYEPEELQTAKKWVSHLRADYGEALSQQDLASCFDSFNSEKDFDIKAAEEKAVFFSGLWETYPGVTRGKGYTINVILEADCENWKRLNGSNQPDKSWLREHEVAIPIRKKVFGWKRFGGLPLANSEDIVYDYDENTNEGTGAKWQE